MDGSGEGWNLPGLTVCRERSCVDGDHTSPAQGPALGFHPRAGHGAERRGHLGSYACWFWWAQIGQSSGGKVAAMTDSAPAGPWRCDSCGLLIVDAAEALVIWAGSGPAWVSDYRIIHTIDPAAAYHCMPVEPWVGVTSAAELSVLLDGPR